MAVTYVGELAEGRRATNSKGVRTYTRVFRLTTSSQNDNAFTVGSNINLPIIGNIFPSDNTAYCTDIDIQCVRGWRIWDATVNYSTERKLSDQQSSDPQNPTPPTGEPAYITWDTEQFQKPATQDRDGKGIVNSAGDPFIPAEQMDDSRRVVTVQKNLTAVPSWILDYQDSVNNASFTVDGVTVTAGKAKVQRVSVGPIELRNGAAFRQVTFVIALRRDGWAYSILDQGFNEKDPADATKRKPIYINGQLPSSPVLLDGTGKAKTDPKTANATYLTYNVYKTADFSQLPLT